MEAIVVVTGGAHEQVERLAAELAKIYPVRKVYNPEACGEMLSSFQTGLAVLDSQACAAMIGLGDQPQVREETVRRSCAAFVRNRSPLVIPSFQNRIGHP
jgi:CTP:molybdopterin cytidylyltransferase MocA